MKQGWYICERDIAIGTKKKAIKCFIGNVETYENKVTFESNTATARLAVLAFFGGWIDIRIPDKNSATPPTFLTFIRSYNAGYARCKFRHFIKCFKDMHL